MIRTILKQCSAYELRKMIDDNLNLSSTAFRGKLRRINYIVMRRMKKGDPPPYRKIDRMLRNRLSKIEYTEETPLIRTIRKALLEINKSK